MNQSDEILKVLRQFGPGPVHISLISKTTHFVIPLINARLSDLIKQGLVQRSGLGHWQIVEEEKDDQTLGQRPVLENLLRTLKKEKSGAPKD